MAVAIRVVAMLGLAAGASAAFAIGTSATYGEPPTASPLLQAARSCPDLSKLRGICGNVDSQITDASNPKYYYYYHFERQVYEAACVELGTDTPAIARVKIQAMWRDHPEAFRCDSSNFDISNGNILKYAANVQNRSFLEKAVYSWKLDLNIVDPEDGQTALDYIKMRIGRTAGTPTESILREYFQLLREHGAKFRSELP